MLKTRRRGFQKLLRRGYDRPTGVADMLKERSERIEQLKLARIDQMYDQLTEKGILPRKPRAGEVSRIVYVERLVHESGAGVGIKKHAQRGAYLFVVGGCERTHHQTHRPSHVIAYMRAAYTFSGLAFEKVRIALAPHKGSFMSTSPRYAIESSEGTLASSMSIRLPKPSTS